MGTYFGTDGFRGEAEITLTADHAYKVGRFLGWYYNALRERNGDTDPARIVIGKDTRRSSYMFEYSLVAGLTASGADTYVINNNAGSTHIEGLQRFIVEKGLDVGFAYDGDADRCLCVDEKGNVITDDHILYIYDCCMKERGKLLTNTVVTTVMSNFEQDRICLDSSWGIGKEPASSCGCIGFDIGFA